MTEYKKLIYELEDTFAMGKELPVVAMRQLQKIADKFRSLSDIPDYQPGTAQAIADNIDKFVDSNKCYIDDERELKDIFKKAIKQGLYSKCFLALFHVDRLKATTTLLGGDNKNDEPVAKVNVEEKSLDTKENTLIIKENELRKKEEELRQKEEMLLHKENDLKIRKLNIDKCEKELLQLIDDEKKEISKVKWTIAECKRLSVLPRSSIKYQDGLRNLYKELTPVGVAHYSFIIDILTKRDR